MSPTYASSTARSPFSRYIYVCGSPVCRAVHVVSQTHKLSLVYWYGYAVLELIEHESNEIANNLSCIEKIEL